MTWSARRRIASYGEPPNWLRSTVSIATALNSVAMGPGSMMLTATPKGASSLRSASESDSTAYLVEL